MESGVFKNILVKPCMKNRTLLPDRLSTGSGSIFIRIWLAIFCSAAGSFLLLMSLSALVHADTGSAFLANGVVITQWLPAVLGLPIIKAIASRYPARTVLVAADAGSVLAAGLIAWAVQQPVWLVALLLAKGGFDSLSKVSRAVALKHYFSGKVLDRAASYYNTAMLVGGGVGALIGALVVQRLGLTGVLALCSALHGAAAMLYATLPPAGSSPAQPAGSAENQASPHVEVRLAVIYMVAAVALFQGYHNIARSVFPVDVLGMPHTGIALMQTVTNAAYVVGAVLAARVMLSNQRYAAMGLACHLLALLSIVPLPFMSSPGIGTAMYAVFAFGFEFAYCVHLRHIITTAPAAELPRVIANANAWALGLMVTISLAGSFLVDRTGLAAVTAATAGAALLVPLFAGRLARQAKAPRPMRADASIG
jgi:predicted MFS family arabinose efflux permease